MCIYFNSVLTFLLIYNVFVTSVIILSFLIFPHGYQKTSTKIVITYFLSLIYLIFKVQVLSINYLISEKPYWILIYMNILN